MPYETIQKSLGIDNCSNDYLLPLIVHIALSVSVNWLLLAMVQYLYHLYSIFPITAIVAKECSGHLQISRTVYNTCVTHTFHLILEFSNGILSIPFVFVETFGLRCLPYHKAEHNTYEYQIMFCCHCYLSLLRCWSFILVLRFSYHTGFMKSELLLGQQQVLSRE